MEKGHPFVKWVGGKTQLLQDIRQKYPQSIKKYCEPFVGGGAVLFDILQTLHPEEVLINDINTELINTYFQVKNNVSDLIDILESYQNTYKIIDEEKRQSFYLSQRELYNKYIKTKDVDHNLEKAALFIFLNKTCFNGLYRVNSKGLFNVPFNRAKNPLICDKENLIICNKLLSNVTLKNGNYLLCNDFIDKDTFVYLDPPYRPLSQTSSFTSYSQNNFSDKDQIELGKFIKQIAEKGAMVVASNSDPKNVNKEDNFFDDLYEDFDVERIQATRMINSNAKKRGAINEILISNIASVFN